MGIALLHHQRKVEIVGDRLYRDAGCWPITSASWSAEKFTRGTRNTDADDRSDVEVGGIDRRITTGRERRVGALRETGNDYAIGESI